MTDEARQRVERLTDRMAMTHGERFESFAEAFYRETGQIAPGRSLPLEMCPSDDDTRRVAWELWTEAARLANIDALRALLAQVDQLTREIAEARLPADGALCLLSDYKAMRDRAEQAEAESAALVARLAVALSGETIQP